MTPSFIRGGLFLVVAYRPPSGPRTTVTLPWHDVLQIKRRLGVTNEALLTLYKQAALACHSAGRFERVPAVLRHVAKLATQS